MADTSATPASAPAKPGKTEKTEKTTGRRVLEGIVTRDKMAKTRRVEVERLVRHAKYGKFVKRRTVCYMHDEKNESHLGDTVSLIESRPLSKLKRWTLVKVVKKAPSRTLSHLEGAVAGSDAGEVVTKTEKTEKTEKPAEEKK
jgi:small subunit ribosomal protein S17